MHRLPGLDLDPVGELADLVEHGAALGEQLVDLPVGVHDRRVVAVAELGADLGQREVGELAAQVHRDLPGHHQVPAAARAGELVDREPEVRRGLGDDQRRGDLGLAALGDQVLEHDLGQGHVDLLAVEVGERRDPDQGTLELADVGLDLAGDELQHVGRRREPVHRGLLPEDRDAGLEVGRLDVGDQAPLEPVAEPVLEGLEPLGRAVGGEHDLLVGVVEGVERVEELLLGLGLALQELDVVDQQHVDVAVAPLEAVLPVVADRVDELVGELLARDVAHAGAVVERADVVADGVEEVGLAQPGVAVDQERVVGLARRLGDRDRGGVGEPVGRADDEALEDVLGVEPGLAGAGAGRRLVERRGWRGDMEICRHIDMMDSSTQVEVRGLAAVDQAGVDGDRQPDLAPEASRSGRPRAGRAAGPRAGSG